MRACSYLLIGGLCLAAIACSNKAPYEGKSVSQLEKMLKDPDLAVQAQGAFGLSRMGADAREAVPSLIRALEGESLVKQNAALALGKVGPDAAEAVPKLIRCLADSDWAVQRQAAIALGEIGRPAAAAKPALAKLAKDRNRALANAAKQAVQKIEANQGHQ
jgi:HEAT repeat protein